MGKPCSCAFWVDLFKRRLGWASEEGVKDNKRALKIALNDALDYLQKIKEFCDVETKDLEESLKIASEFAEKEKFLAATLMIAGIENKFYDKLEKCMIEESAEKNG